MCNDYSTICTGEGNHMTLNRKEQLTAGVTTRLQDSIKPYNFQSDTSRDRNEMSKIFLVMKREREST